MQDDALNCREARARMAGYLAGESCPAVAAHLTACEACLEDYLDAGLRRPTEVRVPDHFRSRVLARLPAGVRADAPEYPWALVAAAGVLAALGAGLWWSGELPAMATLLTDALLRPAVLIGAVGIETTLSLLWLWRVATTDL